MTKKRKKRSRSSNVALGIFFTTLVGLAVREQLSRPSEERTWHGSIFGIPYDFRMPTVERLRATCWNKDSARVFVPQVFGIGWTLNLYPLIHPKSAQ